MIPEYVVTAVMISGVALVVCGILGGQIADRTRHSEMRDIPDAMFLVGLAVLFLSLPLEVLREVL